MWNGDEWIRAKAGATMPRARTRVCMVDYWYAHEGIRVFDAEDIKAFQDSEMLESVLRNLTGFESTGNIYPKQDRVTGRRQICWVQASNTLRTTQKNKAKDHNPYQLEMFISGSLARGYHP
jgi:hypothetical protein